MTIRFDKVFCGYCKRSLPRAAINCVWCRRPIRSLDYGHPPEERSGHRGHNADRRDAPSEFRAAGQGARGVGQGVLE